MRHKEYIETCVVCDKTYVATRKGSHCCSNICRAQYDRNRKSKQLKQFKTQSNVIRNQSAIIDLLTPKPVDIKPVVNTQKSRDLESKVLIQELSIVTGKDLTECKRPDGDHLYTYEDLCLLTAKLIRQILNPGYEVDLFNKFAEMDLIEDFESRFKCRFNDVRKANNHSKISVEMGNTFESYNAFYMKYAGLKYSR
jgi:hypothetical protein